MPVGAGSPEAVLLLHGVPTTGALWDGVRPHLGGYVVHTPDLPGYGSRPHVAGVDAQVEALAGLGLDRPHLVGHDWGGVLAALYAERHPVRSLTLSSTWLGWGWMGAKITALPGLELLFYRAFAGRLWLARGVGPDKQAAFLASVPRPPGLAATMRRTAGEIPVARLARLRLDVPVMCLWGREDTFVPDAVGRDLARRLDGRFHSLPGRHYVMVDAPEAYAAALRAFWGERVPLPRPPATRGTAG